MALQMMETANQRFPQLLKLIFWLLVIKALTVLGVHYAGIGLMPDEAQYWTWSKALSYGYYSKPPGIAWEIAFGTLFFGDTEFGVRLGALILSFALSISVYLLARKGGLEGRYAFWTAIAFSLTPIGVLSTFLATTDCGFVLFWTLAAGVFAKALLEDTEHSFLTIGILIALGALFKWAIYLLWIPIIIFALWQRKLTLRFVVGLAISLVALVPSIIWNMSHEWATFQHVWKSVTPQHVVKAGNPLAFIGAQFALVSPVVFVLLLIATVGIAKQLRKVPLSIAFYFWTFVGIFLTVFALSFFKKVQGNWAVACYPTGFAMLFAYAAMSRKSFMRWMQVGLLISVVLLVFAFLAPKLSLVSYRSNPWKEGLGWERIETGLKHTGYDPEKHFLFSDRYQTASVLSFYGPNKKRAYFMNLKGLRKNQFSYWNKMAEKEVGKTGFFVTVVEGHGALERALKVQQEMKNDLRDYFAEVSGTLVIVPLYESKGETSKVAVVIRAEGYNGKLPPETKKF